MQPSGPSPSSVAAVRSVIMRSGSPGRVVVLDVGIRIAEVARKTVRFHHMSYGTVMDRSSSPGTETIGVSVW